MVLAVMSLKLTDLDVNRRTLAPFASGVNDAG